MDAAEKEQIEQQEAAAMEAGFNGTDLEPVVVEEAPTEPTAEEKAAQEAAEVAAAETAKPAEPQYLTRADLLAALEQERAERAKERDRIFGTIGNFQQKLDAAKGQTAAITPAGWAKLKDGFPELYELLSEGRDMTAAPEPEKAAAPPAVTTQADIDAIVAAKLEESGKETEKKLLRMAHPDYPAVYASPEFATWKDTLPPADAAALDDSWDSSFLAPKLTEFKAWKAAQQTAAAAAQQQKDAEQQKSQERLAAALTPQGKPRVQTGMDDDEETALLAAFGGDRR